MDTKVNNNNMDTATPKESAGKQTADDSAAQPSWDAGKYRRKGAKLQVYDWLADLPESHDDTDLVKYPKRILSQFYAYQSGAGRSGSGRGFAGS